MIKKFLQKIWSTIIGKPRGEDLGFTCCFCNEGITSLDPDPSDIVVVANIDKPKEQQAEQIFYCHMLCLKNKIHPDVKDLFVLDDPSKQNRV